MLENFFFQFQKIAEISYKSELNMDDMSRVTLPKVIKKVSLIEIRPISHALF